MAFRLTCVHIISSSEPLGSSQGELIRRPCRSSVHNVHTSTPLKPLGRSKPNSLWSLLGKGEQKFV